MKIKNFNSGWGQMTITNARGHLLTRLGVENVPERVLAHNNSQEKRERAYNARFFYGMTSMLTIA